MTAPPHRKTSKRWLIWAALAAGMLMLSALLPSLRPAVLLGHSKIPAGLAATPLFPDGQALPPDTVIDYLVVYKAARQLWIYHNGQLLKIYPIALGRQPLGHKQFEGDGKTPEGRYRIDGRNPHSSYHKNLGISYPNAADTAYAAAQGLSAGGLIKIHGLPNGRGFIGRHHTRSDWTAGCIAVTNVEIDELYRGVIDNAVIDIYP